MEKRKKIFKIVACVTMVIIVLSITTISAFAAGSDIRWHYIGGTNRLNPMQVTSLTFKKNKTPNFPNSVETVPIGLPVYNSHNGVAYDENTILASTDPLYNDGIYFSTSSNDQNFSTSHMYLYYKTNNASRKTNGGYITQQSYNLYSGGVWDNNNNQITGEYMNLYHNITLKANYVEIYNQANDVNRDLSSFYIYFASNSIGGDFTLLEEDTYNFARVTYDVYIPDEVYFGDSQQTFVGFSKLFSVNETYKIKDNLKFNPFDILRTNNEYLRKLPSNKPIIITNFVCDMELYGRIDNTYVDTFKYRVNIGQPNQYYPTATSILTSVNTEVNNYIESIAFDDFSFIHWITTNVNSLMQIRFFNLFTVGDIMWIVVALAIFGFFIRLFMGG